MRRFFVTPDGFRKDYVVIRGSDATHIRDVLRMKPGDLIHVFDENGLCYQVELSSILKKESEGRVLSIEPLDIESPLEICLGQAILKGKRFDGVVRKAVELGTRSIVPLITKRTIARIPTGGFDKKICRWQKIAEEASKQCGRNHIPKVESNVLDLGSFCEESKDYDLKLCFWENESSCRVQDIITKSPPKRIAALIGPEGGFEAEEIEDVKKTGFFTVSLGPRLLRAETAPSAALAILQNRWGDI